MLQKYLLAPLLALLLLAAAPRAVQAQTGSVGIGTTAPDGSAALDVTSTSKGLLPPRMDQAQRDAIASPAAGLTIYNTTSGLLNTWDGARWTAPLRDTTPLPQSSVTFAYTGGPQTYTVPMGITALAVDMSGASGAASQIGGGLGAAGGRVQVTLAVAAGQVLTLYVGGQGSNGGGGYNGGGNSTSGNGGGGGASDIRTGGTALADRLLVAGGGGGGGSNFANGGNGSGGGGGGLTGAPGNNAANGGTGGTQLAGGSDGGALGSGGSSNSSGAGGGGYYGGGGGRANVGGGGGGSSYAGTGTSGIIHTQGYRSGNGYISITTLGNVATMPLPAPVLDGGNLVGVIKNQTTPQTGASFNIDGNGLVGGSVGIGTANPGAGLHVVTAEKPGISPVAGVYVSGGAAGNPNIELRGTNGAAALDFAHDLTTDFSARVRSTAAGLGLHAGGSATPQLLLDPAGSVGIGGAAPASAALAVTSTTKGLLPPRLTPVERDAIAAPAAGLLVYNTVTNKLNVWNGTAWTEALSATEQPFQDATTTFGPTGVPQAYTVPVGVTRITVTANGAQGGSLAGVATGGQGARVKTTLTVVPGEVLDVYVGGGGSRTSGASSGLAGGYNGGGGVPANLQGMSGGGATDLRRSGNKLLVAGGGGGAAFLTNSNGGGGGAPNGLTGSAVNGTTPGTGGTQTAGGSVGGSLGQGGASNSVGSGGGGGGYYGGGGGSSYGGGGGGASWVAPTGTANTTFTANANPGDGSVSIVPGPVYVMPALDGTNFVNVPGTWDVNGTAYYYNDGNVGIGTSTPGQKLDVAGNATVSGNVGIGTTAPVSRLSLSQVSSQGNSAGQNLGELSFVGFNRPNASASIQALSRDFDDTGHLLFKTSPNGGGAVERLRITADGNVGVGTPAPAGRLANTASNVLGTDGNGISSEGFGWVNNGSLGYAGVFYNGNFFNPSPGLAVKILNPSSPALDVSQGGAGTAGTSLLRVNGNGSVGIGTASPESGLHIDRPEQNNTTAQGILLSGGSSGNPSIELRGGGRTPYIDFAESNVDFTTRLISQGGVLNVQYGGTAAQPAYILKVLGGLQCVGTVNTSDQRLKQNIRPLAGALASVLALRGVRYTWNALGVQRGGAAQAEQVGVLAQEVEKIFPELVSTGADGYKAVNYAQLTPVLIEALKEQQAQIEVLKARAATAETKAAQATATLETFEARLRRLEATSGQAER